MIQASKIEKEKLNIFEAIFLYRRYKQIFYTLRFSFFSWINLVRVWRQYKFFLFFIVSGVLCFFTLHLRPIWAAENKDIKDKNYFHERKSILSFAQRLYKEKRYREAALEYRRYSSYFGDTLSETAKFDLSHKILSSLFRSGNFQQAKNWLQMNPSYAGTKSAYYLNQGIFSHFLAAYHHSDSELLKAWIYANQEKDSILTSKLSLSQSKNIPHNGMIEATDIRSIYWNSMPVPMQSLYWQIWNRISLGEYGAAKHGLEKLISEQNDFHKSFALWQKSLQELDSLSYQGEWKGAVLSAVIPGTGQMLYGRYSDGWISFAAVALSGGLSYLAYRNGEEGFFIGFTILSVMLYSANIYGGYLAAYRQSQWQEKRLLERIRKNYYLDNIF